MVAFPNCKINLGLSVLDKRDDGYHNLETVFYPLEITDVLEIIPSFKSISHSNIHQTAAVEFSTSGLTIDGNSMDNLCLKAFQLLQKDFSLASVKMHLHKVVPIGAGLGGGSADGSFVLILLNKLFKLGLSSEQLVNYTTQLGSDCPFFIMNKPCFARGRGEIMEPISLDLSAYSIVIVNAGIPVNTGWAFSQLNAGSRVTKQVINIREIITTPVIGWKDILVNDFEKPVFGKHPLLKSIKAQLYKQGALYAAMSGSGSTIFGIFEKNNVPARLAGMDDLKLLTSSA